MKKYIIAVIMAVAGVFGMAAQEADAYSLLVNTKDGNVVEFAFEYCPVATFDGDELVITDDLNTESMRYNMADVANLTFKKTDSGVKGVEAESNIKVTLTKQTLSVAGLEEGAPVQIFDMAGAIVAAGVAAADGSVVVDIDALAAGVYVASMPGNTFKFIR